MKYSRQCFIRNFQTPGGNSSRTLRRAAYFKIICYLALFQVPGQRLVYKFNKLPYKYEPGVTRSLYHGHRIKACLQQQKRVETTPRQKDTDGLPSAFTPVSTPLRKSWTWPLLSTPSRPMLWCPGPVIHTPSSPDYSKTRIVFPIAVDPMTSYPLPFGFKQERVSPVFYKATAETKSIPVSVIKRV